MHSLKKVLERILYVKIFETNLMYVKIAILQYKTQIIFIKSSHEVRYVNTWLNRKFMLLCLNARPIFRPIEQNYRWSNIKSMTVQAQTAKHACSSLNRQ